jgi:hypothetical protein
VVIIKKNVKNKLNIDKRKIFECRKSKFNNSESDGERSQNRRQTQRHGVVLIM